MSAPPHRSSPSRRVRPPLAAPLLLAGPWRRCATTMAFTMSSSPCTVHAVSWRPHWLCWTHTPWCRSAGRWMTGCGRGRAEGGRGRQASKHAWSWLSLRLPPLPPCPCLCRGMPTWVKVARALQRPRMHASVPLHCYSPPPHPCQSPAPATAALSSGQQRQHPQQAFPAMWPVPTPYLQAHRNIPLEASFALQLSPHL